MPLNSYESFRQAIEAKWLAGQHSGNVAAERLYERVLFRLVGRSGEALAHLTELTQGTRDPEVRAWYAAIAGELAALPELAG